MITLDDDINIKDYAAEFRDSLIENYELVYSDLNDLIINSSIDDQTKNSLALYFDVDNKKFICSDNSIFNNYESDNNTVLLLFNGNNKTVVDIIRDTFILFEERYAYNHKLEIIKYLSEKFYINIISIYDMFLFSEDHNLADSVKLKSLILDIVRTDQFKIKDIDVEFSNDDIFISYIIDILIENKEIDFIVNECFDYIFGIESSKYTTFNHSNKLNNFFLSTVPDISILKYFDDLDLGNKYKSHCIEKLYSKLSNEKLLESYADPNITNFTKDIIKDVYNSRIEKELLVMISKQNVFRIFSNNKKIKKIKEKMLP